MMLSLVGLRGSPHQRLGSKSVGAGRHHGAGERVRPTVGPHLLFLCMYVCMYVCVCVCICVSMHACSVCMYVVSCPCHVMSCHVMSCNVM